MCKIQTSGTYILHSPSTGILGNKLDLIKVMIMQTYCELEVVVVPSQQMCERVYMTPRTTHKADSFCSDKVTLVPVVLPNGLMV
jgi:hypothetical protein